MYQQLPSGSNRSSQTSLFSSQAVVTGGTITQVLGNHSIHYHRQGGFERLQEACSSSAFHNSGDQYNPPKCHGNTRVAVIQTIMDLLSAQNRDSSLVWLTGAAGAGKSAIANTIAERCYEEGRLLASFFFGLMDPSRNNVRMFIPTIAYQLCLALPQIRDTIIAAVERDPLVFKKSLSVQFSALVAEPLFYLLNHGMFDARHNPSCIVIDGLDECIDRKSRCELLEILSGATIRLHLPLAFLVASRPEHDIVTLFEFTTLKSISKRLYLDVRYLPNRDIELYLRDKFADIKKNHPSSCAIPPQWPSDKKVKNLISKASGQFIYAATVIKYVSSTRHNPMRRLERIFDLHSDHKDLPFAELDMLYMHILAGVEDIERVLQILGFFRLNDGYWNKDYVLIMLQSNMEDILPLFADLSSLLEIQQFYNGSTECIFIDVLHASFMDFLCDRSRSGNLYLDLPRWKSHYLAVAFGHLSRSTKDDSIFTIILALTFIADNIEDLSLADDTLILNLSQFSVKKLFSIFKSSDPKLFMHYTNFVTTILTFLKSLGSHQCKVIHDTHLQSFEETLRMRLLPYYQTSALQFFLTILGYAKQYDTKQRVIIFHRDAQLFDVTVDLLQLDLEGLSLFETPNDLDNDFRLFLSDFLETPNRAGLHVLRGVDYARSALHCLRFISSRTSCNTQLAPSSAYRARRRRNVPWRSRIILPKKDPFYRLYRITGIQEKRLLLLPMVTFCHLLDKEWTVGNAPPISTIWVQQPSALRRQMPSYREFLRLGLALRYLPYLLKRSSRLEELDSFARKMMFSYGAMRHRRKFSGARKAITKYLVRGGL